MRHGSCAGAEGKLLPIRKILDCKIDTCGNCVHARYVRRDSRLHTDGNDELSQRENPGKAEGQHSQQLRRRSFVKIDNSIRDSGNARSWLVCL